MSRFGSAAVRAIFSEEWYFVRNYSFGDTAVTLRTKFRFAVAQVDTLYVIQVSDRVLGQFYPPLVLACSLATCTCKYSRF